MDDTRIHILVLFGALRCGGMGLLVGSIEALTLAVTLKLPVGIVGYLTLAGVAVGSFGLFGLLIGAVLGVPVHLALRRVVVSRGLAVQLAVTTAVLFATLFSGFALEEWFDGRAWVAVFLAVFPLFLMAVVFLLAGRLFRLREMGQRSPLPFLPTALVAALCVVGAGTALQASKDSGGSGALDSDPRVLVVVVDSLRADLGGAPAPAFDRLATLGAMFSDAVTPSPETAPAVASLFTGLPPLRHEVLRDGDRLRRVRALLAATFEDEGYATGGFVSDPALSHELGFDFGFRVYDDDVGAPIPGVERLRLGGLAVAALGLADGSRSGDVTTSRFLGWLDDHADVPFFAVVHLHEPREPFVPHGLPGFAANGTPTQPLLDHRGRLGETDFSETDQRVLRRLYQEEVATVDRNLGRMIASIEAHDLMDKTVVVVVGTGGELLGEHGGAFTHRGLFDPTVKVPLLLHVPGAEGDVVVSPQVRIHDLYSTLLLHAELEPRHQAEAIPLLDYLSGKRSKPLWTPVVGKDVNGTWVVGARNNGIKYIRTLDTGHERLFDVDEDPDEARDQALAMPDTLRDARGLVASDAVRLGKAVGVPVAPVD